MSGLTIVNLFMKLSDYAGQLQDERDLYREAIEKHQEVYLNDPMGTAPPAHQHDIDLWSVLKPREHGE